MSEAFITNPDVLAALKRAQGSKTPLQTPSIQTQSTIESVAATSDVQLQSTSLIVFSVIQERENMKQLWMRRKTFRMIVQKEEQDEKYRKLEKENMAFKIQLSAFRAHIRDLETIWTSTWSDFDVTFVQFFKFDLFANLHFLLGQSSLITTISTSMFREVYPGAHCHYSEYPYDQGKEWALKTWDKKFSLQWEVLKDLISEESKSTLDSVIDSWFSIIFSASYPSSLDSVKICFLPTILSGLLEWQGSSLYKDMIGIGLREMMVDNYWHQLECLYMAAIVPGKQEEVDHWILLRVLIGSSISYIEVYDSLKSTLVRKHKQQIEKFLGGLKILSWSNYVTTQAPEQGSKPIPEHNWQWKTFGLLEGEALRYKQDDIPAIRKKMLGIFYANMEACKDWN
ncbi:hypothetical protein HOY82DRAFT_544236 [Tuber indicum]|nr:hypothetical protein HOY82DRAFT_544236 [Tuber indicum]